MKITIYELLGLVKDNKAPKKIKYGNIKLEYDDDFTDYYEYCKKGFFEYKFTTRIDFLNDEVEIIDEDKKIEKIDYIHPDIACSYNESEILLRVEENKDKINELIDEINNLKENKYD